MKRILIHTLLLMLLAGTLSAQHQWQRPIPRDLEKVIEIMGPVSLVKPTRDLNIIWVWGKDKNHAPGIHEYIKAKDLFSELLELVPSVTVEDAEHFPSKSQWAKADLVVFYLQMKEMTPAQFEMMDGYLKRGGGMVAIHAAFIQGKKGPEVSKRFGLAWAGGKTKWGVLPVPSKVQPGSAHGIFKRFPKEITLVDEHYWGLGGNTHQITVLATSQAATVNGSKGPPKRGQWDGVEWPLFWTNELGEGRVFCSIPGHNLFTFNDPFFRIILLRGMAWAMREPFDPFIPIVTHNALLK